MAGAGLAGLGAIGLQRSSKAASAPKSVDVVVVGAGLSGLTAARELRQQGLSVHILEARNEPVAE